MARAGELWGGLRAILRGHPTFAQIKDMVGVSGLQVERLAHIQQKQSGGASKAQLLDGIDGLVIELDDDQRDKFVIACTEELLRQYGHLREEVDVVFGRLGGGISGIKPFMRIPEKYFPPGSQCDVQIFVSEIVQSARRSIWICDPYMDEKIVEELSVCTASDIRLMTKSPKGLFRQRLAALTIQMSSRGITVDCKIDTTSHDRFYIIDQKEVWVLGASLNQAGSKATIGHKISVASEADKIISGFKEWWAKGSPLESSATVRMAAQTPTQIVKVVPSGAVGRESSFVNRILGWCLTTAGKIIIGVAIFVLGAWLMYGRGPWRTVSIALEKVKIEVYQDDLTGQSWRVAHFPVQIYNGTGSTLSVPYWKLTNVQRLENGSFAPWGEIDSRILAWPRTEPRNIASGDTVSVPFARIYPAELQKFLKEGGIFSGNPDVPQLRFNVMPGGWARRMTSHIPPGTYRFKLALFSKEGSSAEVDIELEWTGAQRDNVELMAKEIRLSQQAN